MASLLRFPIIFLSCFVPFGFVTALNNTNSTWTHEVSAVVLDNEAAFGVCVYPRSVSINNEQEAQQMEFEANLFRAPTPSLAASSTTVPSSFRSSREPNYGS